MLCTDCEGLVPDGKDIAYVTASVVDKDGNLCPLATDMMTFSVTGAGSFRAAANGDPTCLLPFHEPRMNAFSGKLSILLQSGETSGNITLTVKAKGLRSATITVPVK